ncbi:MAG: hypothetical protein OEZ31_08385, partial [Nitrospirota bacterium]|nr:hypothetical protein [Nitrospirota bacterium]
IDSALSYLNEIIFDEKSYYKAKNGLPIINPYENKYINQYVRLKSPEKNLFGIGRVENSRIKTERLLN